MEQAIGKTVDGGPQGEVQTDMPKPGGDSRAAGLHMNRPAHGCNQEQTHSGPGGFKPLAGSDESNSPAKDQRREEIDGLAGLKIEVLEAV